MMPRLSAANNAMTVLVQAVGSTDTTIYVQNVSAFPTPPFRVTVDSEIMEVTSVDTTLKALTVLRAQEGTTATSHSIGASVENRWTAGTYGELAGKADLTWGNIAGKPSNFTPSVHGNEAHNPNLALASDLAAHLADTAKHQRTATFVVAASNSSAAGKAAAQYICDGVSDQTEINTALNALSSTGGMVLLLEGTFIVDGPINVPSNATLAGQGRGTVIKVKDALNTNINVLQNADQTNGNTNITLRDFSINGNRTNNTVSTQRGIYLYKTTHSTVSGLLVSYCWDLSIYLESSSNNTITGNTCQSNANTGIYLKSSSNNTITGNTCQSNASTGIYLNSSSNNTITGNTCLSNSHDGIYLYSSSNNTITGNTCSGNAYGINLYSSSNNTITGNTCQGNNYNGIEIGSSNNNTIVGNTCLENSQEANATYDNIRIDGTSSYNNVQGNTCRQGSLTNKPRYGIRIDSSSCTKNLVTNNDLYTGGATAAFSDAGTSTVTTAGNRTA